MKIGLDLDEVVVEYAKGYLEIFKRRFGRSVPYERLYSYNLWDPLEITKQEAITLAEEYYESEEFENIDFVEGAREGVERLAQRNDVSIITSRPLHIRKRTDEFLRKKFPCLNIQAFYSGDFFNGQGKSKPEICLDLGVEIMIEDNLHYAVECANKGFRVLLLNKPWNQNGKLPLNVCRVNNWQEILQEVKNEN